MKGLRNGAILSFALGILILLGGGYLAKDKVPPVPEKIIQESTNKVITSGNIIKKGQSVYQKHGLMDHGSVWGHGTLRGMDFSATSLHKMGEYMREYYSKQIIDKPYSSLTEQEESFIKAKVISEIKENNFDKQKNILKLNNAQVYALKKLRSFWNKQFKEGNKRYGFLKNTIKDKNERKQIADFFLWTAWSAGTKRPNSTYTYTNNWPPDKSVGNNATGETVIWTLFSIFALLVVLGIAIYVVHRYRFFYGESKAVQASKELLSMPLTPSQKASGKFFIVAGVLFLAQILNGGLLAHYTVEPASFYIDFIGKLIPYSWAKSWHLQLAIFWISISWIGTAIFIAPLISRKEPKYQKTLVNILFATTFLVVIGSLFGEVLGLKGLLGDLWFWIGHQGWEYLELGRLWQILLFGGMIFWLFIVYRPLAAYFKRDNYAEPYMKSLVIFYVFSAVFVVAFFAFGLLYGPGTHFSIADFFRWFVVHIWVESIFEFFGVAVTALFLVALGLVTPKSALRVGYFTAILVFVSGLLGTAHHYFWFGGPSFWLAIGGVFGSIEPVPLILLVSRAWMEYSTIKGAGKDFPYKWPLFFLIASSIWNFIGAGVFGFLINLPIVNYFEHATYLTANHAHTALFGVYGMLAIALLLFSWRTLIGKKHWDNKIIKLSFWGLNGGLALMSLISLFPVGMIQMWYSYTRGFWFARSADFYEIPIIKHLGNLRIIPDFIIISFGVLPLLYFIIKTYIKLLSEHKKE